MEKNQANVYVFNVCGVKGILRSNGKWLLSATLDRLK